jgi:hypothetical protein
VADVHAVAVVHADVGRGAAVCVGAVAAGYARRVGIAFRVVTCSRAVGMDSDGERRKAQRYQRGREVVDHFG